MNSPGRYLVVAGLFLLSLITYIDRAAISSVKEPLSADLALNDQQMGAVFSAFALGYAIAQVPSGWFADKAGPRLMLTAVVTAWSILTALTGWVQGLLVMLLVRFLFGIAEAGAFPGSARVFYNWLPRSEHGRANGIIFAAARLGAAFAFPLMAWLLASYHWRTTFYLLAVPGLVWAFFWAVFFRNEPAQPPVREATASAAPTRPFGEIFRSRPMLFAMTQYFFANFTTFLCLSWMNPYLKTRYELSVAEAAYYTTAILLIAATAQWATGWLVDRLYRSNRREWSRRLPAMLGFCISAVGAVAIPFAPTPAVAAACFSLAAFGAEMTISPSWAFCIDIGGVKSGAVSGSMNMLGNFGSFVSANAFPFLQGLTGSASAYFWLVAVFNIGGAFCWLGMKSRPPAAAK
jgi:MFS transporter, ACS family, glucarate transporter